MLLARWSNEVLLNCYTVSVPVCLFIPTKSHLVRASPLFCLCCSQRSQLACQCQHGDSLHDDVTWINSLCMLGSGSERIRKCLLSVPSLSVQSTGYVGGLLAKEKAAEMSVSQPAVGQTNTIPGYSFLIGSKKHMLFLEGKLNKRD